MRRENLQNFGPESPPVLKNRGENPGLVFRPVALSLSEYFILAKRMKLEGFERDRVKDSEAHVI